MNDRHFEILKEMIIDFNEYSTDYTKTRCKELEQVLTDTLNYINQLQSNWNSLREFFENGLQSSKTFKESDAIYEDSLMINKVLEVALDKMNELEGKDKE